MKKITLEGMTKFQESAGLNYVFGGVDVEVDQESLSFDSSAYSDSSQYNDDSATADSSTDHDTSSSYDSSDNHD